MWCCPKQTSLLTEPSSFLQLPVHNYELSGVSWTLGLAEIGTCQTALAAACMLLTIAAEAPVRSHPRQHSPAHCLQPTGIFRADEQHSASQQILGQA
jgi:hypothetical protein